MFYRVSVTKMTHFYDFAGIMLEWYSKYSILFSEKVIVFMLLIITDGEESESESWIKELVVLGYISLAGCMQDFLIGQAHRTISGSCSSRSTVQRDKLGYSGKRIPQRQRPGPDEMTAQQHISSQEPERLDVRIRLDTKP